jgi:hypothetical protein
VIRLKYRIKAWNIWRKRYYGLTWLHSILVFFGIIHSPTFDLEYCMTRYKKEDDNDRNEM